MPRVHDDIIFITHDDIALLVHAYQSYHQLDHRFCGSQAKSKKKNGLGLRVV